MVSLSNRTSMALFSDPMDHYSHRVRIVMEEKGVTSEIIDSDTNDLSDEILEVSPYAELPVLVDRDVCLYDSLILMEYLDERFPHPPLLPVDPISRAKFRLALNEIEQHWYVKYNELYIGEVLDMKFVDGIKNYLLEIAPMIKNSFFMSDDFGLVDCSLAPLLWRLKSLDFDLASNNKIISEYSERIFAVSYTHLTLPTTVIV